MQGIMRIITGASTMSLDNRATMIGHEILKLCPIFETMTMEELNIAREFSIVRKYTANAIIFQQEEFSSSIMFVLEGRVKIGNYSKRSGKEVIFYYIEKGEPFGEVGVVDSLPREATATSIGDSRILEIHSKYFYQEFFIKADWLLNLSKTLSLRFRRISASLADFGTPLSVRARLARKILQLAVDYGQPDLLGIKIGLKLSQAELGALIGATREHVGKLIREWEIAELLAFDAGYMVILSTSSFDALVDGY